MKSLVTRRGLFALGGGAALSYFLVGCGGGDSSSAPAGNSDSGRTVVSGDLKTQINQFSTSVEQLGGVFVGTSASFDGLRDFTGRASRAPADVKILIQALGIGLNGTRVAYERLANSALMLDDLGAVAGTVTSNNNLTGGSSVNNPQWIAGMMFQNYAAIRVTGALFKIQLVAGLQELKDWALAQTTPQSQLVCYGLAADVFNTWVEAVAGVTGIAVDPSWKLDLSTSVAPANIPAQFAKIPTILAALPFSPGYRTSGSSLGQLDDLSLGGAGIVNFAPSLTGVLSRLTLSTTALDDTFFQTVDPAKAKYDVATRLGATGVGTSLAALPGGIASAQTVIDALLTSTASANWPGLSGASATCQFQIIGKLYGFLQSLITAIVSSKSVAGTIIGGSQALKNLDDLDATVGLCGSAYQKAIWQTVRPDLKTLHEFHLYNGSVPTTKQVSAISVAGLKEYDQLAKYGVVCNAVITVAASANCPIDPKKPEIVSCRTLIAGLVKNVACPRTFSNVEICVASLIYDLSVRNTEVLNGKFDGDDLSFCYSQYSRLYSREPGVDFIEIPAITDAALLCSAVGYIPSKSITPVNLSTIAALPNLSQITNLVGGVPVNVK